jgi:hypothetical protein
MRYSQSALRFIGNRTSLLSWPISFTRGIVAASKQSYFPTPKVGDTNGLELGLGIIRLDDSPSGGSLGGCDHG